MSSLHIAGFKSLSEVNIDLGRINVIIGANGSGKSNLLEAIGVLGAAASGSVEPETLRYRGVRPGLPTIYKSSFQHERIRRVITLTAESSLGHFQVGLDNPISSTRTKWRIHSEDLTLYRNGAQKPVVGRSPRGIRLYNSKGALEFLPEQPATDEITMSRSQVLRWADTPQASELIDALINFAIFSPNTPVLRGLSMEDISREPVGLNGSGLPQAYRSLIREWRLREPLSDFTGLIDWAVRVNASPSVFLPIAPSVSTAEFSFRFVDKYMRSGRNVLSGYDASEGALYIIFMAVLALHPLTPPIIAIDNFDQALHPRLVRELMERFAEAVLQRKNSQVFLSTHNPSTLDGIDIHNEDIRLFAVDRDKRGATMIRHIDLSFLRATSESATHSLSELWVMGRLGAVPRIF